MIIRHVLYYLDMLYDLEPCPKIIGYVQQSGGGWSKDLFVVDIEELEKGNKANDVHIKRFKSTEIHVVHESGTFRFPVATREVNRVP